MVANLVNIVLNATFVLVLHWGIAGSAWGTAIAQTGTAAAYLTVVGRGAKRAGVSFAPDLAGVRAAAFAGASLVARTLALQAALIITTAIAARQGNAAIAAHQVAFRIWTLLTFALDAIAIAAQAITGRYLGAGDVAGAHEPDDRLGRRLRRRVRAGAAGHAAVPARLVRRDTGRPAVVASQAGLVVLWLAYSLWMLARLVTLTLRARGSRWLITGAVRNPSDRPPPGRS